MIYTKNGDKGQSSIINGFPISKDAPVFQILGTIDELSSSLGVAKFEAYATVKDTIHLVQEQLIQVGTSIAGGKPFDFETNTANFETLINAYEEKNQKRNGFSVSGETKLGALLDLSRSISRRLERAVVAMTKTYGLKKEVNPYFNRLSDLLYVLARYADSNYNTAETRTQTSAETPAAALEKDQGLSAASAVALCQKVIAKARQQDLRAVCSVCNKEGNVIALIRDDDAFIASIEIAQNKAWTSVALKMSTKQALEYSKKEEELYGLQFMSNPKLILLPGGQTLTANGEILGGLGVSGGFGWQDEELSSYGKNLFERGDS